MLTGFRGTTHRRPRFIRERVPLIFRKDEHQKQAKTQRKSADLPSQETKSDRKTVSRFPDKKTMIQILRGHRTCPEVTHLGKGTR